MRRSTTSSFSSGKRWSLLSKYTSTYAEITCEPLPSWSSCFRSSCESRELLPPPVTSPRTNWIAAKKFDLPEPLAPTAARAAGRAVSAGRARGARARGLGAQSAPMMLCCGLKGSGSMRSR